MMVWHCLGIGMVKGSSFGEPKVNFIFGIFGFDLNMKSWMKP